MKTFKPAVVTAFLAAGSAAQAYQLPSSWILNGGEGSRSAKGSHSLHQIRQSRGVRAAGEVSRETEEGIDEIFEANRDAIESAGRAGVDVDKWHLEFFTVDLGVTASGTLGVLAMKGTHAVQVYWRRRDTASARAGVRDEPPPEADIVVTDGSTGADLGAHAQSVARALERSGVIRDAGRASAGLARMSEDLRDLVSAVPGNPGHMWWLSTIRFDVSVDASGAIYPGVKAGAAARVRFDVSRLMRKGRAPTRARSRGQPRFESSSLASLVAAVVEELDHASRDEQMERYGFEASSFRIGIGVGASGEFGVAKAGASTMGHLIFTRGPKGGQKGAAPFSTRSVHEPDSPVLILGEGGRGLEPLARIDRREFRRGMAKAIKMGRYFAKRADKANRKKKRSKWAVSQIKTMFDVSVGGDVGVAQLSGSVSTELVFKNTGF